MAINIRRYEERDFHDLTSLYRDFYNEMRGWQSRDRLRLDEREAVKITRESLEGSSVVFFAEDKGKLIGFARIQSWDGAYFVREVFIKKQFRRMGMGSRLLAKCEEHVRKNRETSVYLTVEPKHSISIKYLIHNGYDTLNMLELRKDLAKDHLPEREGNVEILGHRLHLLKRNL